MQQKLRRTMWKNQTRKTEQIVFISFALENLIELRRLLPEQPIQYPVKEYNEDVLNCRIIVKQQNIDAESREKHPHNGGL